MSDSKAGVECINEVTLAISKARDSQAGTMRVLDSPDSDESGHSNSFTVQRFNYSDSNMDTNILQSPLTSKDLRIPIVGYEVMEERARFTVGLFCILMNYKSHNYCITSNYIDSLYQHSRSTSFELN